MADNIFRKDPPITGGTFYNSKQFFNAKESLTKMQFNTLNNLQKDLKEKLKSDNFTYNYYFLLQQQADYFSNIVPFRFNTKELTEAIYKVIRCGVIYGKSAVWITSLGKIIPLYINDIDYDPFDGRPIKINACLIDKIFSQKVIKPTNVNFVWFEENKDDFSNLYIFNSTSNGFGGLITWQPFLRQLENLLRMLYTHSYSYLKTVLYDVKDPSAISKELDLFFSNENPFLLNIGGDDVLFTNKFKEFNFTNTDKSGFFEYLEKFLNTYYSLIGRRYNVDFKKERNVSAEVESSQDNFDILQNELYQYIKHLLDWVYLKTGVEYVI